MRNHCDMVARSISGFCINFSALRLNKNYILGTPKISNRL